VWLANVSDSVVLESSAMTIDQGLGSEASHKFLQLTPFALVICRGHGGVKVKCVSSNEKLQPVVF